MDDVGKADEEQNLLPQCATRPVAPINVSNTHVNVAKVHALCIRYCPQSS